MKKLFIILLLMFVQCTNPTENDDKELGGAELEIRITYNQDSYQSGDNIITYSSTATVSWDNSEATVYNGSGIKKIFVEPKTELTATYIKYKNGNIYQRVTQHKVANSEFIWRL